MKINKQRQKTEEKLLILSNPTLTAILNLKSHSPFFCHISNDILRSCLTEEILELNARYLCSYDASISTFQFVSVSILLHRVIAETI